MLRVVAAAKLFLTPFAPFSIALHADLPGLAFYTVRTSDIGSEEQGKSAQTLVVFYTNPLEAPEAW